MRRPRDLADLQEFYCSEYRPLYDRFVVETKLPQELHAEVAAAFDHLMRHSSGSRGKINNKDFDRVIGHLKRATFDSFKLLFENGIRAKYDRLMNNRYANVEDGDFQPRITALFNQAVTIAKDARMQEHSSNIADSEAWGKSFDVWKKLLPIVDEFSKIENDPKILRAKKQWRVRYFWIIADKVLWVVVGAILSCLIAKSLG